MSLIMYKKVGKMIVLLSLVNCILFVVMLLQKMEKEKETNNNFCNSFQRLLLKKQGEIRPRFQTNNRIELIPRMTEIPT